MPKHIYSRKWIELKSECNWCFRFLSNCHPSVYAKPASHDRQTPNQDPDETHFLCLTGSSPTWMAFSIPSWTAHLADKLSYTRKHDLFLGSVQTRNGRFDQPPLPPFEIYYALSGANHDFASQYLRTADRRVVSRNTCGTNLTN